MSKQYGHIPDGEGQVAAPVRELIDWVGAPILPVTADLTSYITSIKDQGPTSSCVGQAIARAVHMRAAIRGVDLPFPSAMGIYTLARQYGHKSGILMDTGSQPFAAVEAVSKYGLWSEDTLPFDIAKINDPLPWDVLEAGYGAKLSGYYKVYGDNEERCKQIRQALALGYPVAFGMDVDEAYENSNFSVFSSLTTQKMGQHMQCIVGYEQGTFRVCNSWGVGWGDGGLAWLSDSWVGSGNCFDFYVITVTPEKLW